VACSTFLDLWKSHGAHCFYVLGLVMFVGDRGDICDDQAAHQLWVGQRKCHRRFATHRVTEHIHRRAVGGDHFGQILGHIDVPVVITPWALPVVAQVDRKDLPHVRQTLCDNAPVAPGAKQTMHD